MILRAFLKVTAAQMLEENQRSSIYMGHNQPLSFLASLVSLVATQIHLFPTVKKSKNDMGLIEESILNKTL